MNLPKRKKNRLRDFDYSQNGRYFVTICVKNKQEIFGLIKNNGMILNEFGKIAENCWSAIPKHLPSVELDEFVVMPNHIHGIVVIENQAIAQRAIVRGAVGGADLRPLGTPYDGISNVNPCK